MSVKKESVQMQKINAAIFGTCLAGLLLSYYSNVVEVAKEKDETYEAMCDISEHISCTKAFSSEYGKGFGLLPKDSAFYGPNYIYGLVGYTFFCLLSLSNRYGVAIFMIMSGVMMNLLSLYLASILVLLKNICLVCVSIYIVNAIFLILAIKKYRILFRGGASKKKKTN